MKSYRGVADGQVIFSIAKEFVYFTHGVCVLASVQFDLDIATERPTAVCPAILILICHAVNPSVPPVPPLLLLRGMLWAQAWTIINE